MQVTRLGTKKGFHISSPYRRVFMVFLSAALVFVAGLPITLLGMRLFYAGKTLPGVQAAGIDLSGKTPEEIVSVLSARLTYPTTGLIVFQYQQDIALAKPTDLGVSIDLSTMTRDAMRVGREGNIFHRFGQQLDAWFNGSLIQPIVVFDQQKAKHYLSELATQIDRPKMEAHLEWEGMQVEASPGQIGRQLNIQATLESIYPPISRMIDGRIDLVVEEIEPMVMDASVQAALMEKILSEPLVLSAGEEGSWTIEPEELADMLHFSLTQTESKAEYQISLDKNQFIVRLTPLSVDLDRKTENARFIFNDETKQLELLRPEAIGRRLDIQATLSAIQETLYSGNHKAALVFEYLQPQVKSDATAEDLGISEAVSVVSTYFYDSGSSRVHNISTAATAFHGYLVGPGETLSMAEVLGDISLDTGYAEALIIYGDSTVEAAGGGVCQVSTTLFRAAFFGGYPIVERYPHAYRVGYYEQGPNSPGPGFDATVFVPIVDFKFTNDRPYWLLLETYIYGNQLLWKFYSTSDGRQVEWSKVENNKVEAPEPLYRENLELPEGKIRQVEWQADGLDVIIERTVLQDNDILYEDRFVTHYQPWRAVFEYGPGTKLPKDAKTE